MTEFSHHGICRFCLSFSTEKMHSLTGEPEILKKIHTCFSMHITIRECFPEAICTGCKNKIDDIHNYYEKIKSNEYFLTHNVRMTDDKAWEHFYCKLKGTKLIKQENDFVELKYKDDLKLEIESKNDICLKLDNGLNFMNNIKAKGIDDDCTVETTDVQDDQRHSPVDDTSDTNKRILLRQKNKKKSKRKNRNSEERIILSEKSESCIVLNAENNTNYKCLSCFEVCSSKQLLLCHYNSKHKPKEKGINAEYATLSSDGVDSYKCCVCDKIFENKKGVTKHVRGHADGRSFLCKTCGRTYRTASEIVRHGRAHDGSKVYCSHNCGYSTAYLGALLQHEKRHEGDHKYKCEECGKGFQVKTWFLQHQNVHKGLKPFACDICGVAFHMDRYLTAHKSSVHPQTSEVKRYICPHCSLPCDSRKAFTEHLKEHGIKTSYLCDLCGKSLSNAEQLKFHKRMHLGVKPYSCSTCNKSFAKKFNLQLHMRTHSGEKAHACVACGKRYTQRSALLRHHQRHHSNGNQKCNRCNKTFQSSSLLTSHQRICM